VFVFLWPKTAVSKVLCIVMAQNPLYKQGNTVFFNECAAINNSRPEGCLTKYLVPFNQCSTMNILRLTGLITIMFWMNKFVTDNYFDTKYHISIAVINDLNIRAFFFNEMKENKLDRRDGHKTYIQLVRNSEEYRPLQRHRNRCNYNIEWIL